MLKEITEFLSALAGLLVVLLLLTVFVFALVALFRPPKRLRDIAASIRVGASLIKRLKLGSFEAELDRPTESPAPSMIAAPAEVSPPSGENPPPPDSSAPSGEATSLPAPSTTSFVAALSLFYEGKHKEGMKVLRDVVAQEQDHGVAVRRLAYGQYVAFAHGYGEAFMALAETIRNNPTHAMARTSYADALFDRGEIERGRSEYDEALKHAVSDAERAVIGARFAQQLVKNDFRSDAKQLLKSLFTTSSDLDARAEILFALADTYDPISAADKDHVLALQAAATRCAPSNRTFLFKAGFVAGDIGAHGSSYLLYSKLVNVYPKHKGAWNNLAVAADYLRITASRVDAYRRAEELGETLAMSNLARIMAAAGFLREAESLVAKAKTFNDVDEQVDIATGDIAKAKETDKKRNEELQARGEKMNKWRFQHAEALLRGYDAALLPGQYVDSQGRTLIIERDAKGQIAGNFQIDHERPATLRGTLDGAVLSFAWKTSESRPGVWTIPEAGRGVLIAAADGTLTGFWIKGETPVDVDDVEKWAEWRLMKVA